MAIMLKKLTKIKGLGVFKDFTWSPNLPEFRRYNVIYGWNGAGKTTLSKLLDSLNSGQSPEFDELTYSALLSNDITISNGTPFITPVRVFNRDYIDKHIDFYRQSSTIINYVLTEDEGILRLIRSDEKKEEGLKVEIEAQKKLKSETDKSRGKLFTEIAKTISQGTQGAIVRNYNKTNAESAFKALSNRMILDDAELEKLSKSVTQRSMPKIDEFSVANVSKDIADAVKGGNKLLQSTVESMVINRLKENSDISEWVEKGIGIHQKHKSEFCEFCGSAITENRFTQLTSYFNAADAKFKEEIDELIENIRSICLDIQNIALVDKMNLYEELRDEYTDKITGFLSTRDALISRLVELEGQIKDKKAHTTEKLPEISKIPDATEMILAICEINATLKEHNDKTDSFDNSKKVDSKKIESHFLSTVYDDIMEFDAIIIDADKKIDELQNGVEGDNDDVGLLALSERISNNKAKISSSNKACQELNDNLKKFLGRSEISFEVSDDETGYLIKRNNKLAKNLSEGEKTAIAFVFFIIHLKDEKFDVENGIIVVDDPISSLDSNSQFQAFSFMKTATKNASQLFILTHNFDFLKLTLGWITNSREKHSLYMVKNSFSSADGTRVASIDKIDPVLEKFETEYHYLFNVIYRYKDDGMIESAYNMPNIARKLLDTFLMFCVPTGDGTYRRLEMIQFDEVKKTAIYKFVNDQSHITGAGFDPSLVPETQKCVGYLLELMESEAKNHFDYLVSGVR